MMMMMMMMMGSFPWDQCMPTFMSLPLVDRSSPSTTSRGAGDDGGDHAFFGRRGDQESECNRGDQTTQQSTIRAPPSLLHILYHLQGLQ
jgi:hypothetical protein